MDERRNRFHPWQAYLIIMGTAHGAGDVFPRKGASLRRNEGSESHSEKELLTWGGHCEVHEITGVLCIYLLIAPLRILALSSDDQLEEITSGSPPWPYVGGLIKLYSWKAMFQECVALSSYIWRSGRDRLRICWEIEEYAGFPLDAIFSSVTRY